MGISREIRTDRLAEDHWDRVPPSRWSVNSVITAFRLPPVAKRPLLMAPQDCVHWSRTEHAIPSFPCELAVPSHQAAVPRSVPVFETPYPYVYLNEGFREAIKSRWL
jgi:hypothetical protein